MSEKKETTSPTLKRSWFQGLKVEAKKITWPDKKRVGRETTAVVISAIVIGAVTMGIDLLLSYGLSFIIGG